MIDLSEAKRGYRGYLGTEKKIALLYNDEYYLFSSYL